MNDAVANSELERPGPYPCFSGWVASPALFATPPSDFRLSVYWFWSREVDRNTMEIRLQDMKRARISCFWIQPRLGFPMDQYLSAQFFDDYRFALDRAKDLGLRAGIYDDYNWITGHCAGRTVEGNECYREAQLFWTEAELNPGSARQYATVSGIRSLLVDVLREPASEWLYGGEDPLWTDWQVLRAFAYRRQGDKVLSDSLQDITNGVTVTDAEATLCRLRVDWSPPGDGFRALVFVSARSRNSLLIDYLNPAAVQRFVEVGYEPYREHLASYFGDPLYALFFDEPYAGFYDWRERVGNPRMSIMYNADFFEGFASTHGYRIEDHLCALIYDCGPQTSRYRCEFYEAYSQRAQATFFRQIAEWCKDAGLPLTGHELMTELNGGWGFADEANLFDTRSNFGADHFGIGNYKAISCVDSGDYSENLAAKMGSSIAHLLGKNGTMLEQYNGCPDAFLRGISHAAGFWDLTLEELKHQVDWYALQGLTKFVFHAFFQSNDRTDDDAPLKSQRFDFPPGINFEPWWEYGPQFSDHIARLMYFLSLGHHVAEAAVFYPLRTYWAEGQADVFARESAFYNENLIKAHFDYDIVDETALRSAEVKGGQLRIADEGYDCLVLPAVSTLQDVATVQKMRDLCHGGGSVLASGRLPDQSQAKGWDPAVADECVELAASYPSFRFRPQAYCESEDGLMDLLVDMEALVSRHVSVRVGGMEDPGVIHCLREDEEAFYLALMSNEAKQKFAQVTLFSVTGLPEIWNPEDGSVHEWLYYRWDHGHTTVFVVLAPLQSICIRLRKGIGVPCHIVQTQLRVVETSRLDSGLDALLQAEKGGRYGITLSCQTDPTSVQIDGQPAEVERLDDRLRVFVDVAVLPPEMVLDSEWDFSLEGETRSHPINGDEGWESQGYPDYAGAGIYEQQITLPESYLHHALVLDCESVYCTAEAYLNGRRIGVRPWRPYLFTLPKGAIQPGLNTVRLRIKNTAGNHMYAGTRYEPPSRAPAGLRGRVTLRPAKRVRLQVRFS